MEKEKDFIKIGPDEYLLGDDHWITVSRYAAKYGMGLTSVSNWIARGIVPDDCVVKLEVLNNLKIIRDQPYESRNYNKLKQNDSEKPE